MTKSNLPAVVTASQSREIATLVHGEETKGDKFKRLANARSRDAIHKIDLIGNLAGPAYDFTNAQVTTLEVALTQAVKQAVHRLRSRKAEPATSTDLFK